MRVLVLLVVLFCANYAYSQDSITYKDSVYNFEIGIPAGWRYGKPKNYPDLLLVSIRNSIDTTKKFVETFNVSVVHEAESNLDTVFSHMLKYNSLAKDFKVLEKGNKTINREEFKWVISSHANKYNGELLYNYVLITYNSTKAYILTFGSTPKNFELHRLLFEKIAETFKIKNFS